jgi:hypothetical protein
MQKIYHIFGMGCLTTGPAKERVWNNASKSQIFVELTGFLGQNIGYAIRKWRKISIFKFLK